MEAMARYPYKVFPFDDQLKNLWRHLAIANVCAVYPVSQIDLHDWFVGLGFGKSVAASLVSKFSYDSAEIVKIMAILRARKA